MAHVEELKERTVLALDDGKERRWKSSEGDVFYLAIGVVCDKAGEPIQDKPSK